MRLNPPISRELTLRYWSEFSQSHHNFAWQHRRLSSRVSTILLENCNESERICKKRENVSRGPNGSRTQQLNLHWGVFPALDVAFVMPCNQPAHVPSGIYMGIRLETVVRTNRMLFVLASLFKLIWWGKFTITKCSSSSSQKCHDIGSVSIGWRGFSPKNHTAWCPEGKCTEWALLWSGCYEFWKPN